jgi:hypothetical protein
MPAGPAYARAVIEDPAYLAVVRGRHQANSHARGPGCHCKAAGALPERATGTHPAGCAPCDAWRASHRGQAERAYWERGV